MKRILLSCSAIVLAAQIQAQPWLNNAWLKGGNPAATNFQTTIGTNNTWNAPFQLMTNWQIRMHINQNGVFAGATNASGLIGIGSNFITPLNLLHLDAIAYNTGNIFRTDGNRRSQTNGKCLQSFLILLPPKNFGCLCRLTIAV